MVITLFENLGERENTIFLKFKLSAEKLWDAMDHKVLTIWGLVTP